MNARYQVFRFLFCIFSYPGVPAEVNVVVWPYLKHRGVNFWLL